MEWADLAMAIAVSAGIAAIWVLGLWLLALGRRDISLIDSVFSLIVLSIVGVAGVAMGSAPASRKLLIFGLMCIWSVRATAYITWRKWGEGEDPRYTKLRSWKPEGREFNLFALRQVFALQGVTMFLLGMPAVIALTADEPDRLGVAGYVGAATWAVGFFFEAVGDAQLVRFKRNPANEGKILDTGLSPVQTTKATNCNSTPGLRAVRYTCTNNKSDEL